MEKIFIDKELNIFYGLEAEKLINEKNDSKYIVDDAIMFVDKERWQEAQHYEKKTWMVSNPHISDDRNNEHFSRFNSYEQVISHQKNHKIKRVIELGCGPFTNLRTMIGLLPDVSEIHLLDPLLNDYLNHPNCFYKNKKIGNLDVTLHSIPIEEFSSSNLKYDMVIMNNVLEHCYDINKIFEIILNILSSDGLFVFSDVYFTKDDTSIMVKQIYDTGHPLKLSEKYMKEFLSNFKPIFERDFNGLYGQNWRNDKYFIGYKK